MLREADFATLWKHKLNPDETGVAARAVALKNISTPPPCQTTNFMVVGTATNLGEASCPNHLFCIPVSSKCPNSTLPGGAGH